MGGVPYARSRDEEFGCKGIAVAVMVRRVEDLQPLIPNVVAGLTQAQLDAIFPEPLWGAERVTSQFLFHLYGHLNYHLGQIGYLRRILTGETAVKFVQL